MSRDHPLAPHRAALFGLVIVLGLVAALAASGPTWLKRYYYPLDYEAEIAAAADEYDVDPYLVAAVIECESGFDPDEVSEVGAVGLMQLMSPTARDVAEDAGVDPGAVDEGALADPETNIGLGTCYLAKLLDRYEKPGAEDARAGRVFALAAYNAGMGRVDEWAPGAYVGAADAGAEDDAMSRMYPETRHYVLRVLAVREEYERLYPHAF
jgi:soluble lytic murein transglycosylase